MLRGLVGKIINNRLFLHKKKTQRGDLTGFPNLGSIGSTVLKYRGSGRNPPSCCTLLRTSIAVLLLPCNFDIILRALDQYFWEQSFTYIAAVTRAILLLYSIE